MQFYQNQIVKQPISDEQIIALYWSRDEGAIKETDYKLNTEIICLPLPITLYMTSWIARNV